MTEHVHDWKPHADSDARWLDCIEVCACGMARVRIGEECTVTVTSVERAERAALLVLCLFGSQTGPKHPPLD